MNQTYKVRMEDGICTVKSQDDHHLLSKASIEDEKLSLDFTSSGTEDFTSMVLLTIDFILSHLPEIKAIELKNETHLQYPFNQLGKNFGRNEFYQIPTLWHHTSSYDVAPEKWTETNGRTHPIRPQAKLGYVYKRYIPSIEKTISFRLSHPETDLETFHHWHNQPRVSFYWELNKPIEELKVYMEKSLQDPHQIPLVVEIDGELVGYYEMYWVREDRLGPYYESDAFDRGFHFLIGNKNFLGNKITDSIIKSGIHLLYLDDPRTRRIMAEPRHDNQKVLKYAEASVGWRKVKLFDFPHKTAWLLENSREIFFGGHAL